MTVFKLLVIFYVILFCFFHSNEAVYFCDYINWGQAKKYKLLKHKLWVMCANPEFSFEQPWNVGIPCFLHFYLFVSIVELLFSDFTDLSML